MNNITVETKKLQDEIIEGLKSSSKSLPSKLFYDDTGSKLFDKICELEEYYLTRTELKIMEDNITSLNNQLSNIDMIIELGSGSSSKTRILLNNLPAVKYYIPIDISSVHLLQSANALKKLYPEIKILPLVADYTEELQIPMENFSDMKRLVYYPGSTIGNFTMTEAKQFLEQVKGIAGSNGQLLIGVDLVKDSLILTKAYNDKEGVTAEFNLNILNHVNKIFGSDIRTESFRHYAYYNTSAARIEMYLISLNDQEVKLGTNCIRFYKDEPILTEYSNKYTIEDFKELASGSFKVKRIWTDNRKYFSVQLLESI